MDIPRYLIFDHGNEMIDLSVKKIKGDKLIIMGKKIEDIKKFNPKCVLCYQNEEVIYECRRLNVNCVHLYTYSKYRQNKNQYLCNLVFSRFDLSKIEKDDKNYRYNFTMIDEGSRKVAELLNNFENGNHVLVNPGEITTSRILEFYQKEFKELVNGENKCSISSYDGYLSNIQTYFEEKENAFVNIYIPTYHRLEKTKTSLISIISGAKLSKYDIKIYIGDNSPNYPKIREWLTELDESEEIVSVHLGEKNIGKSGMVNHLYRNSRKCDYLFSIDSDMIVSENHNFVDDMIFHLTRLENCGLVSSNHKDCIEHWFGRSVEILERNGMKVGYSKDGVGIAGCCVCLRSEDWEAIGMYKENHDIYTGDDGILTHNIEKILGKYVYISIDCSLTHPRPGEEEKGYSEWKKKSWERDQLKFLDSNYTGTNTKGFYD